MNIICSKYVQGTKTLYYSRKLRFDDIEIGCNYQPVYLFCWDLYKDQIVAIK